MKYSEYLYDHMENKYPRKNQYIIDIVNLQKMVGKNGQGADSQVKGDLKSLLRGRDKHPYNLKLREYRQSEKKFLGELKKKRKAYKEKLEDVKDEKLLNLKVLLYENQEKYSFYKTYVDLSYDAELAFRKSEITKNQLEERISFLEENNKELEDALIESKNINGKLEDSVEKDIRDHKIQRKKALRDSKRQVKENRKKGLISKKAMNNQIIELKNKYKSEIMVKSLESPRKSSREKINSIKYQRKYKLRQMMRVLKADIADLRRNIPVETAQSRVFICYITALLPGLGQILNRQYLKGLLFFLGSLFIYLVALPYGLGYGNYQGNGVRGLITLAEGGLRIHKSLIFMIEGVIAVFLGIIALFILFISFRDVITVEKNRIKGIREKNWFEISNSIREEGFPYVVSAPAFIVIIFIVLVPVVTTILLSFTGMDPNHQSKFPWVGLKNYQLIALGKGLAGSVFWLILGWTVLWTLLASTLAIIIGFGLALLVNSQRVKFKRFFRTIYLLPWAVPAFITIMFFSIMFSPNGAITEILNNVLGKRIEVKNTANLTRAALIFLQGWLGSSYVFLLSTGVLQSIPYDLHEAADMDGASSWKKTSKIVVPLVLFQTAPLLITQYTFNFNNFSIIHLFNGGGPFNPNLYGNLAGSSDLLISYIYKLTIENQYQSIGAAITVVISLGLMIFAYIGFKNSKGFKEGKL